MSTQVSDRILSKDIICNINKQTKLFSLVYLALQLVFLLFVIFYYMDSKKDAIQSAINEYQEVDMTYLCNLSKCKYIDISLTNHDYTRDLDSGRIEPIYNGISSPIITIGILSIYPTTYALGLNLNKEIGATFLLVPPKFIIVLVVVSLLFWLFTIISFNYYLKRVAKASTLIDLVNFAGKEAQLSNKNMVILTENIHHEVKTPIAIITNKVDFLKEFFHSLRMEAIKGRNKGDRKIDRMIMGCPLNCDGCHHHHNDMCSVFDNLNNNKVDEAFEMIDSYISAIYVVLERMKNFKQIKYSNGNKSLYDIASTALQTLKLHHKGLFEYDISESLKNFKMAEHGLKNEDVLNILLNHIKNSLEAKATKIVIEPSKYTAKKGMLSFTLTDNGNGIPEDIVERIFDVNFSTKAQNGDVRGIGMYISRSLLRTVDGDEKIVETSSFGTVLEITLPTTFKK